MAFRSTSQFRFEASKAAEATGRPGPWLRRERSGGSRPVDSREQQFASLDLPADRGQPRFSRLRKFGKHCNTAPDAPSARFNAFWSGSPSSTRVGWTIGAGTEYAITNNVTIGAEYLYADLGSKTITANPNSIAAAALPGVYATAKINYNASIFRALVNYKF